MEGGKNNKSSRLRLITNENLLWYWLVIVFFFQGVFFWLEVEWLLFAPGCERNKLSNNRISFHICLSLPVSVHNVTILWRKRVRAEISTKEIFSFFVISRQKGGNSKLRHLTWGQNHVQVLPNCLQTSF